MTHLTPMTPLIAYGFRLSSISLYIWECWCIIKRMDPRMRGRFCYVFYFDGTNFCSVLELYYKFNFNKTNLSYAPMFGANILGISPFECNF
ncbi:hypothetical protein Ahy_A07g034668 isoform A [Arachis hypogaea]|uniref:Uncharacterized protein n=1 Tax=Arachis hypogaea TaxID=3818 RepID=A0A445CCE8_ARAHY|nr:hypothetical protein Ahy_A07g034668 isoform A [Arachis hypogaea]